MSALFAIKCAFKPTQSSPAIIGLAICSDADTPVTFIHPDGTPYLEKEIWTYDLMHFSPWAKLEL